jgi:CubicO group peptidase (beta-lactamase class C family)
MIKFVGFGNILLALIISLPMIACSQIIQTNTKNSSVDYQKLEKIDNLVNDYIAKNWLTRAVTIVVKDNQLVQYKGYGYSDVATKKPMKSDAIFRIMSQTKAITSAGIMILYEQGKLLLDEPISDFIPEFKNPSCSINLMKQIRHSQLFLQKESSLSAICSHIHQVLTILI